MISTESSTCTYRSPHSGRIRKEASMQCGPSAGQLEGFNSQSEVTRFSQNCQNHSDLPVVSDGIQGGCWDGATFARYVTWATLAQWLCSKFQNPWCATHICIYTHSSFTCSIFNLDAYSNDYKRDKDYIPDLLADVVTFTHCDSICCEVMQLTSTLQTTEAYWANLTVKMSIDRQEQSFWLLLLSTISGHFKVYLEAYITFHY